MKNLKEKLYKSLKKDQYSKKEVIDEIIRYVRYHKEKSKEEVINDIDSKLSELREKINNDYYFRISPEVIAKGNKDIFRRELYHSLNDNDFFKEKVKIEDFKRVFSGIEAKKNIEITKIKWKKNTEAIYLLYYLWKQKILDQLNQGGGPELLQKKAKKIFDVNNARQVWYKIKEGDSIPKRFGEIEGYVHNAMDAVNAE